MQGMGPSLYLVHRLVVASAVALAGLFSLHSGMRYEVTRDPATLGLCLLAAGTAAALALYLWWFVRRHPRGR
jgi:hypothetical protein